MSAEESDVIVGVPAPGKPKFDPRVNLKINRSPNNGQPGPGRGKGTPNKITRDARKLFTIFVERNLRKASQWLDTVAKEDPARALDILLRASEFVVPKLTKSEYHGPGGAPLPLPAPGTTTVVNQAVLMVSKDDSLALYRQMVNDVTANTNRLEANQLPRDPGLEDGVVATVESAAGSG